MLGGCQFLKEETGVNVVPMYASAFDAQATALGQFGAVPIELNTESDLTVMKLVCDLSVAQVKSISGKVGWTPLISLPAKVKPSVCTPAR